MYSDVFFLFANKEPVSSYFVTVLFVVTCTQLYGDGITPGRGGG